MWRRPKRSLVNLSNAPSRVLIVKLSSLGDVFHALPLVAALQQAGADSVDWVTQPEYVDLVRCFRGVDRVVAFPRRTFFKDAKSFASELRSREYDLVLDAQGLLKSALVTRLARAKSRLGCSFSREGAARWYDGVAGPCNKERHAVDEIMDFVSALGLPSVTPEFGVRFPEAAPLSGGIKIGVLPASRWPTKNWPASSFAETIEQLACVEGRSFYLLGGKEEVPVCTEISKHFEHDNKVLNMCGTMKLVELGSVLQQLDLLITVDSGPMHMAAALGIPVLALFGPTDPVRTGPYGSRHTVVKVEELSCAPCFSRECKREKRDHVCMQNMRPTKVVAAVEKLLRSKEVAS